MKYHFMGSDFQLFVSKVSDLGPGTKLALLEMDAFIKYNFMMIHFFLCTFQYLVVKETFWRKKNNMIALWKLFKTYFLHTTLKFTYQEASLRH